MIILSLNYFYLTYAIIFYILRITTCSTIVLIDNAENIYFVFLFLRNIRVYIIRKINFINKIIYLFNVYEAFLNVIVVMI